MADLTPIFLHQINFKTKHTPLKNKEKSKLVFSLKHGAAVLLNNRDANNFSLYFCRARFDVHDLLAGVRGSLPALLPAIRPQEQGGPRVSDRGQGSPVFHRDQRPRVSSHFALRPPIEPTLVDRGIHVQHALHV